VITHEFILTRSSRRQIIIVFRLIALICVLTFQWRHTEPALHCAWLGIDDRLAWTCCCNTHMLFAFSRRSGRSRNNLLCIVHSSLAFLNRERKWGSIYQLSADLVWFILRHSDDVMSYRCDSGTTSSSSSSSSSYRLFVQLHYRPAGEHCHHSQNGELVECTDEQNYYIYSMDFSISKVEILIFTPGS